MWTLYEKKSLGKILRKIPTPILKQYELWKRIVELEGPTSLRRIKGYHDEALKGTWLGYRSSRLTLKWRVIYQETKHKELEIYVIDINPHDY